jgi:hypothetical protein
VKPELEIELRKQAELAGVIDPDLVTTLPAFAEAREAIKNSKDIRNAIHAMRQQHPALFRPKDWAQLGDDYAVAEAAFRQGLRKPRPFSPTPFRDLDAARLDDEELKALDKCVGGQANSWDRGLLTRALSRQKAEDNALRGGDAA